MPNAEKVCNNYYVYVYSAVNLYIKRFAEIFFNDRIAWVQGCIKESLVRVRYYVY